MPYDVAKLTEACEVAFYSQLADPDEEETTDALR